MRLQLILLLTTVFATSCLKKPLIYQGSMEINLNTTKYEFLNVSLNYNPNNKSVRINASNFNDNNNGLVIIYSGTNGEYTFGNENLRDVSIKSKFKDNNFNYSTEFKILNDPTNHYTSGKLIINNWGQINSKISGSFSGFLVGDSIISFIPEMIPVYGKFTAVRNE